MKLWWPVLFVILQSPIYNTWNIEVAACLEKEPKKVVWVVADSISTDSRILARWAAPSDTIYLRPDVAETKWVVKHELMHLYFGENPGGRDRQHLQEHRAMFIICGGSNPRDVGG